MKAVLSMAVHFNTN